MPQPEGTVERAKRVHLLTCLCRDLAESGNVDELLSALDQREALIGSLQGEPMSQEAQEWLSRAHSTGQEALASLSVSLGAVRSELASSANSAKVQATYRQSTRA